MKTKIVLESKDARIILDACRLEAERLGLAMSIAIVDDGAYPLCFERMDGAGLGTVNVALAKARTAASMRASTKNLADRVRSEPELLRLEDYIPLQGGLPIIVDGQCVGGVGLSGAKAEDDEQVAAAGIAALLAQQ